MNINFDFNSYFQQRINQQLKNDEKMNIFVELANKYGIFGTDVIEFVADIMTVLQQFKKDESNGGN